MGPSKQRGLPFAVIDNTLLSRLVALEIAEFLPWVFKRILIPPEVKREAYKAPHKGKRRLQKLVREMAGFFVDCYEADEGVKEFLKADFGSGEAAAIAQASHTDSILLIDERAGHRRAETMQISVMRTTELIIKLKVEAQVIESVKPYYDRLEETGFYLRSSIRKQLLADVGEGE
jgi:predicted nucleic acid-binding protein